MLRSLLRVSKLEAPFRHGASTARRSVRTYATVSDLSQYPKVGNRLHGFTLRRSKYFPELELSALEFQHDRTGAQHLHIARDDSNNVFSIGFKTNPPDATGVPHILEHTTLCGSKMYPVRDPFFKMLPRSLSNFMNAFTSSDHTTYPFATTNPQDFKNLMSVYLDATLHPLLNENDFNQEGWRIGPVNPLSVKPDKIETKDLTFKGVVYNEMKGQMSDAGYLYYIRFHEHIIPALNNSGGDPQKITDLTHAQLRSFHQAHYHPSNAKIFSYGNFDYADHLASINSVLSSFEHIVAHDEVKEPVDLTQGPRTVTMTGPVDPLVAPDAQFKTSISWVLDPGPDRIERFSLSLLGALLIDGYGSPMYQSLIEAGFGTDYTPNTGFDSSAVKPIFSIGLTGVKQENVNNVKSTIENVLATVKQNGFPSDKIEGYLHQLELGLKHKTANFGMGIMQRIQPDWFNGLDPFDTLAWQDTVEGFKAKYSEGGYLESLIDKHLLGRNVLTFTMEPSQAYSTRLAEEEAARLSAKIASVEQNFPSRTAAYKHLAERELELLKEQEAAANQDLSCLPSLNVQDIPRQKSNPHLRFSTNKGVTVQWHEAPTNGLTYFRAIQAVSNIPAELREMLPLFTEALMRLGTKEQTIERLEEMIRLKTGGVSVGYHLASKFDSLQGYEEGFSLSGHAFDSNVPAMFDLLQMIIRHTNFDGAEAEAKIRELVQASSNSAMDSIASRGHAYARRFAEASLSLPGYLKEQTAGLTHVKLTASLAARSPTESFEDVIRKLKAIQRLVISSRDGLRVALTCGPESVASTDQALSAFLETIPTNMSESRENGVLKFSNESTKSFFDMPYQVSYVSSVLPTVPYIHPMGGPLQILAQLLTHKHLHREIREKGGAYGGGAYAQGLGGVFGFYSYRDPNPQNTINIIKEAGLWATRRNWTREELGEAKLSVFQGLDAPQSVSEEGMTRFVYGIDQDLTQQRRERLLDVTAEDVKMAAQKYLVDAADQASIAVLGPKSSWVDQTDGWTVRDLGLLQESPPAETNGVVDGVAQPAAAAGV